MTRRTIEKIIFRKDSLELVISLEDTTKLKLEEELSHRLGGSAKSAREGIVNPDAPACSTSSNVKLAER